MSDLLTELNEVAKRHGVEIYDTEIHSVPANGKTIKLRPVKRDFGREAAAGLVHVDALGNGLQGIYIGKRDGIRCGCVTAELGSEELVRSQAARAETLIANIANAAADAKVEWFAGEFLQANEPRRI